MTRPTRQSRTKVNYAQFLAFDNDDSGQEGEEEGHSSDDFVNGSDVDDYKDDIDGDLEILARSTHPLVAKSEKRNPPERNQARKARAKGVPARRSPTKSSRHGVPSSAEESSDGACSIDELLNVGKDEEQSSKDKKCAEFSDDSSPEDHHRPKRKFSTTTNRKVAKVPFPATLLTA